MENETYFTFLRHGRSRADDENVHEGRYDSPLTEVGRAQVQARAQEFVQQHVHFDAIIASPLQRAHETAAMIGQALNVPVETDPDWMERDNGPLAGMPFDLAEERYPQASFRNPYESPHGAIESDWHLYCRAAGAVEKVIRRGAGHFLVVAHGGILNAALMGVVGAQPSANQQGIVFGFGDTGYARLRYSPAQHIWCLLAFKAE